MEKQSMTVREAGAIGGAKRRDAIGSAGFRELGLRGGVRIRMAHRFARLAPPIITCLQTIASESGEREQCRQMALNTLSLIPDDVIAELCH